MMVPKFNIRFTILCRILRCNFLNLTCCAKRIVMGLENNSVIFLGLKILGLSFFWVDPRGGTCENFDRGALVIFLGLKFTKMSFFWVSLSWHHFFGVEKIAIIFLGSLKICIIFWDTELGNYDLNQLMEVL